MKLTSLLIFLLLSAALVLTSGGQSVNLTMSQTTKGGGSSGSSSSGRPPAPSVTDVRASFKKVDAYSRDRASKVEARVGGEKESDAYLVVRVKTPTASVATTDRPKANQGVASESHEYYYDLGLVEISEQLILDAIQSIFSRDPHASSFAGVSVRQIGATADYEVVQDYVYEYGENKITVPKGFIYDRASIPRMFWIIVDKDSLSNVAPLFHDLLYRNGGRLERQLVSPYRTFSREDTDNLFLELMTRCGVEQWRRIAAYQAVRHFAASSWKTR